MKTAAEIRAEGRAMTPEQLTTIARKCRTEIGGLYDFIAAVIEQQHPHARVDATGYLELDSDREFTRFLESLDPLTMHPSGMPTAWAIRTAHDYLVPTIRPNYNFDLMDAS